MDKGPGFEWLTTPDWSAKGLLRWTTNTVRQIADDIVNKRLSYKQACKTSGYNYIGGIWQRGKYKDKDSKTEQSNPVYRRLQSCVRRIKENRRRRDAENSLRRVQQQHICGRENTLAPSTSRAVLGTLQPVSKSFNELLGNHKIMKQRSVHLYLYCATWSSD